MGGTRVTKRAIFRLVFCLALALGLMALLGTSALAAGGTCGTCTWNIDDDGLLTIRPTNGVSGELANWGSGTWDRPPWYDYASTIKKAKFEGTVTPGTCHQMFYYCSNMTSVDTTGLNMTGVTSTRNMFFACENLADLDVSNWNMSKVTDMNSMFSSCGSLEKLDVSNWNVSSAEDMSALFWNCVSLKELDVSRWNVAKVKKFQYTFAHCAKLAKLDVSDWQISSAETLHFMFERCYALEKLDVSKWKIPATVKHLFAMFRDCSSLKAIDVSNWDVSHLDDGSYYNGIGDLFRRCTSLTELDLGKWVITSKVLSASVMLSQDTSLKKLVIGEGFYNPTRYPAGFPVDMWEIAQDENNPQKYAKGANIPSGTQDRVTAPGKAAVYVVRALVTFDPNGGAGAAREQNFYYSLAPKGLTAFSATGFSNNGYPFLGWNTQADGSGAAYTDGQVTSYDELNGDLTLYAQWAYPATITYVLDGGSINGSTENVTVHTKVGDQITILDAPEKDGFDFDYWEGSVYHPGNNYPVKGEHTFTAKWIPKPTVPKTGDTARPALYLAFAALSALALLTLGWKRRAEK